MKRLVVGTGWLAAAAAVALAVRSAPAGDPAEGGDPVRVAEAARQLLRVADLEERMRGVAIRETEERDRTERLKTPASPSPMPLADLLRDADEIVDAIDAMKDLDEDVRHALVLSRLRGVEQVGVRDWVVREHLPRLRELLVKAGIPDEEAGPAVALLTDLLVARTNRQLDVYEEIARGPATSGALVAEHHRLESAFYAGMIGQSTERLTQTLGRERALAAMRGLVADPQFRRPSLLQPLDSIVEQIQDKDARATYGLKVNDELDRLAREGHLSLDALRHGLFLDEEGARALRSLLSSARVYVEADEAHWFDSEIETLVDNGLARTKKLEQMVLGLRRLAAKK